MAKDLRHNSDFGTLLSILDCSCLGVCWLDRNHRISRINRCGAALLGYSTGEVIGLSFAPLVLRQGTDNRGPAGQPGMNGEFAWGPQLKSAQHTCFWRKDGSSLTVEYTLQPDLEGKKRDTVLTFLDRSEFERRENEFLHLSAAFANAADGIALFDALGKHVMVNRAYADAFDSSREELAGRSWRSTVCAADNNLMRAAYLKMLAEDRSEANVRLVRRDGSHFHTRAVLSKVYGRDGAFAGHHSFLSEPRQESGSIEQVRIFAPLVQPQAKAAEASVLGSEQQFRAFFEHNPLAVWITGGDGRIQYMNESASRLRCDPSPVSTGDSKRDIHPAIFSKHTQQQIETVARTGEASETIEPGPRPDGTMGEFLVYRFPIPNPGGELTVGGIATDVTEHRRIERALSLRDLAIEAVSPGITITDPTQPKNPIVYASPGFLRLTGYELKEVLGRNCRFLSGRDTDPAARAQISNAIRDGQPLTVVLSNYRKDGTTFWNELSLSPTFDADGQLTSFVGVHTDVTQRRQLEEQHRQAHKMEAIGQLAGGIAHDFNNLLTIIIAYSDLLLEARAFDQRELDGLVEISKAGERAASLTRQLLAFSRSQQPTLVPIKLNTVIRDMETMLRRVIGEDIEVSAVLQPGLHRVMADPGQLAQVLLNLSVNARDAMPHGGKLVFETRNVELSEDYAKLYPGVVPGAYVMLSVTDTGAGMTRETMHRIFEPNFTTKKPGMGTGLGLSVVQGVVTQSKGHIDVEGELGVGTTFKIYLPRTATTAPRRIQMSVPFNFPPGRENILLVEDETAVRELSRKILTKCGYTVFEAQDPDSALTIARECHVPIHLLVTDIVMPGAGGCWFAEQLQDSRPAMRVLFVSGCLDDAAIRQGVDRDEVDFLTKPFSPIALAQKVRDVIDRR